MRTLPTACRGAVAALALTLVPCSVHAQSDWAITHLGTLGGLSGEAEDINDVGQVVGAASPATGSTHAFLWTEATGMTDLGTLGGSFSAAFAINNQGQVVGIAAVPDVVISRSDQHWGFSGPRPAAW